MAEATATIEAPTARITSIASDRRVRGLSGIICCKGKWYNLSMENVQPKEDSIGLLSLASKIVWHSPECNTETKTPKHETQLVGYFLIQWHSICTTSSTSLLHHTSSGACFLLYLHFPSTYFNLFVWFPSLFILLFYFPLFSLLFFSFLFNWNSDINKPLSFQFYHSVLMFWKPKDGPSLERFLGDLQELRVRHLDWPQKLQCKETISA